MLRSRLNEALKDAIKAKQPRRTSTLRLILAALKDRDIAARSDASREPIPDSEIQLLLQKMVKQRQESIGHYEEGGRLELAEQEAEEIGIIREFLPQQMDEQQIVAASREAICEVGAQGLKDMGRVMAALKERHAGQMDFARASATVRQLLTAGA